MNRRQERRSYAIGYGLALALTLLVFALVGFDLLPRRSTLWVAGVAAVMQIVVHFRFFLHIRLKGQTREDLQLILFTTLLLLLMGGGTIWIMTDLSRRM